MKLRQLEGIACLLLGACLCAPARADNNSPERAVPGTLNYVEGNVSMGSQALNSKSIGSAELEMGQSLTTEAGKAEILLTPGVFLRVGDHSSVKMVSSSLTDTEVALNGGEAIVEVAEIHPENDIRIAADGETTTLLKTGLYDFDLNQQQLRVFEGKARVEYGDRHLDVKGGREFPLGGTDQSKPRKFDKNSYDQADLYRWSSLRSAYVAEANVDAAGIYADSGWGPWGPGWWGAGWYWDPWFDGFTFIPGDGIFYSPFGWGFYSPWWVYQAPFYGRSGYRYPGVYHHFSTNYRNWGPGNHYVGGSGYARGIYRGPGSSGGGFHSGPRFGGGSRGFSGGGFHGGGFQGGGFHGGAFHGGGFHGGVGFHGGGGFHGR
jgi:hypothetical protein